MPRRPALCRAGHGCRAVPQSGTRRFLQSRPCRAARPVEGQVAVPERHAGVSPQAPRGAGPPRPVPDVWAGRSPRTGDEREDPVTDDDDAGGGYGDEPEVRRLTAHGHRLDGPRWKVVLIEHRGGWWTIYGLPRADEGHAGAHGVRLAAAELTALCEAVLGRAG